MLCGVFVWQVHNEWMLAPGPTDRFLGRGRWVGGSVDGWVVLLVGSRIDCWHTHTDLRKVTDAGMKDFSAALGSSSTITTVKLSGKSERLVR